MGAGAWPGSPRSAQAPCPSLPPPVQDCVVPSASCSGCCGKNPQSPPAAHGRGGPGRGVCNAVQGTTRRQAPAPISGLPLLTAILSSPPRLQPPAQPRRRSVSQHSDGPGTAAQLFGAWICIKPPGRSARPGPRMALSAAAGQHFAERSEAAAWGAGPLRPPSPAARPEAQREGSGPGGRTAGARSPPPQRGPSVV